MIISYSLMYRWLSSTTSSAGAAGSTASLYGSHRSANHSRRNSDCQGRHPLRLNSSGQVVISPM